MRKILFLNNNRIQRGKIEKNKISKIWIVVIGFLATSFLSQFLVSNILAIRGEEVIKNTGKISQLTKANQELKEGLAENMSIIRISDSAKKLGLTEPSKVVYYELAQPVAVLPQ